jgi:hypothetical protein
MTLNEYVIMYKFLVIGHSRSRDYEPTIFLVATKVLYA